MRRLRTVTVAAVALGAAAMVPGSGFGETRGALAEECPAGPDFNGDRCGDLVVADPDATVDGKTRAGRVNVLYGGDGGARHLLAQGVPGVAGTPETDDRFGAIVRAAHIDEDGFADLVVAVPSESVGSAEDRKSVV